MINRIYLDYNATAPLSSGFISALHKGQVPEGNASSIHGSGKQVQKKISEVSTNLYDFFKLDRKTHNLLFHSGATEALNTFFNQNKNTLLAYFATDHPSVKAVANFAKERGQKTLELPVCSDGSINESDVIAMIKQASSGAQSTILHFTHMNSETGVIWDLEIAKRIKDQTHCLVYADCVQSPGKLEGKLELLNEIDVYTFSGHKFGALKGVGFSFYRSGFNFTPLILGGGQQKGMRSGTINSHAIISLDYALTDLKQNLEKQQELKDLKKDIIEIFKVSKKIKIIENKSLNTICLIHDELRADIMLIHFDLNGLDVSSGSACSSGSVEPSKTLLAMGFKEKASNSIRISLGINNLEHSEEIIKRIKIVASKL